MTEPVAYWHIPQIENEEIFVSFNPSKTSNFEDIPLYTAEDLHPRVKMTQAEFDEFMYFYERYRFDTTTTAMLSYIRINKAGETKNLYHRFYDIGTLNGTVEAQFEFSLLWVKFDSNNPEEMIEIVPDMKWFVRSKELEDDDEYYLFLSGSNLDDLDYLVLDYARAFDTKEEAELWTNPLTEAVPLPVEDE